MQNKDNIYLQGLYHLDLEDEILNKNHYGYYVVTKKNEEAYSCRLYFSQTHKIDYYKKTLKTISNKISKKKLNEDTYILINENTSEEYTFFIVQLVMRLFSKGKYSRPASRDILRGVRLIMQTLENLSISKEYIYKLNHQMQIRIIKENKKDSMGRLVSKAFLQLSQTCDSFVKSEQLGKFLTARKKTSSKTNRNSNLYQISPVVLYQLRHFAIEELNKTVKKHQKYQKWIKNYKHIFNQKSILKTLLSLTRSNNLYANTLYILLNKKHKDLYNKHKESKKLRTLKEHRAILENLEFYLGNYLSNADILEWDIKTFSLLMYATGCDIENDHLETKFHYGKVNTSSRFRRSFYSSFGINRTEYIEYSIVDYLFVYPLFLLSLIETGRNMEVLNSWEVRKEGDKFVLGVDRGLIIDIEGYKNKSDSGSYDTAISKDSKLWKYLDVFLEINNNIYHKSQSNNFFQYYTTAKNINNARKIQVTGRSFFSYVKSSNYNFFKKYMIVDQFDNRITRIDHTLLRKAHNYQMYLQGKTLYERQVSKNHKDANTTENHYSTDDWKLDKQIKLGDILEDIFESIFNGKISREKNFESIDGLLADCIDNQNPTYIGQKLKNNHNCLDWKKCLTMCDKCIVIPKIHGPAIFAWRKYLLELKEVFFIEEKYFKKENYHYDLQAAEEALSEFTEEEYDYSSRESHKYNHIVKIEIPTSVKSERS